MGILVLIRREILFLNGMKPRTRMREIWGRGESRSVLMLLSPGKQCSQVKADEKGQDDNRWYLLTPRSQPGR